MGNNKKSNKNIGKQKKKTKRGPMYCLIAVILAVVLGGVVLTINSKTAQKSADNTSKNNVGEKNVSGKEDKKMVHENVKVAVEMEDGGKFVLELYPEYAPQTVQNFVDLVEDGFYDGVGFHRIVDGFMAQGGDPEGTGMGGSGVEIPGEFASNGFAQNTLSHTRGVVSMARSQDPDSASSQFFICYDDANFLDGNYAAFGKVIDGMDVVDGFLDAERTYNSMGELATPVKPITMKKVTIIED